MWSTPNVLDPVGKLALASMYWCMTTSKYILYVGFDYKYIDINTLAQGIKSFLASQVWFQAVDGARTYGTDSPTITSQPHIYVCQAWK